MKNCMETMKIRKITICGGGNGAQTLVPIAAHNLGCPVDVYAPFADEAERLRAGVAAHGGIEITGAVQGKAQPRRISADPGEVIPGSDVVVLVLPAFAHESTLRQIAPFLDEGAWVGAMSARRKRIILEGTVPSPIDPPSGCRFHTRCFARIGKICEEQEPVFTVVGAGHQVACHLFQ